MVEEREEEQGQESGRAAGHMSSLNLALDCCWFRYLKQCRLAVGSSRSYFLVCAVNCKL